MFFYHAAIFLLKTLGFMENKGLFLSPGNKLLLEKWGVNSACVHGASPGLSVPVFTKEVGDK